MSSGGENRGEMLGTEPDATEAALRAEEDGGVETGGEPIGELLPCAGETGAMDDIDVEVEVSRGFASPPFMRSCLISASVPSKFLFRRLEREAFLGFFCSSVASSLEGSATFRFVKASAPFVTFMRASLRKSVGCDVDLLESVRVRCGLAISIFS